MDTATELTAVAKALKEARERRTELIRQRRAEGASLRTIAREADMCNRSIHLIVGKDNPTS